jgi:hypothetical protein
MSTPTALTKPHPTDQAPLAPPAQQPCVQLERQANPTLLDASHQDATKTVEEVQINACDPQGWVLMNMTRA